MLSTYNLLFVNLVFTLLCSLFDMTNSRTSTMWKLNARTGKIEKHDLLGERIKEGYASVDENLLYNFNAMAMVYSRDESFFTIVSSTRSNSYGNGWARESLDSSLASLLQVNKLKTDIVKSGNKANMHSYTTNINRESEIALQNYSQNFDTLDCGQPINYTTYNYIINLKTQYGNKANNKRKPNLSEPEVIYFFLNPHDQDDFKNFNVESLEKRLKLFKKQNFLSAELFHHIGNYWRIIGEPLEAIKCFRRSLDIKPAASEVMYDLAKVLYNLQYIDDAINMARRSIEFQIPTFSAWRQYLLLGDIMRAYGDLRSSVHYYRMALDLNPTHEVILRSLKDAEQKPAATLHTYTIVIIIVLVSIVLIAILTSMMREVKIDNHCPNAHYGNNLEMYDVKQKRQINRTLAVRPVKGLSTSSRSIRQRKH